MALSTTSRNQLNAILSLLTAKDMATIDTLQNAAGRLLDATNKSRVLAVLPTDGWSATPKPTEAAALATLIADIAAN